jgi:Fe-S-cluster containining protein
MGIDQERFCREYAQVYPPQPGMYLLRHKDGACIFLTWKDGQAFCSIHDVKPEACRSWAPSLERQECRDGLKGLGEEGKLIDLEATGMTSSQIADFCKSLMNQDDR